MHNHTPTTFRSPQRGFHLRTSIAFVCLASRPNKQFILFILSVNTSLLYLRGSVFMGIVTRKNATDSENVTN